MSAERLVPAVNGQHYVAHTTYVVINKPHRPLETCRKFAYIPGTN